MGAGPVSAASTVATVGLLVSIAAGLGGYAYGIDQGKALEKGRQDAQALQDIKGQLTAHTNLIKQSGAASRSLRQATALREQANEATSKEMSDALTSTAENRAGCVFPARVMHDLAAARARAAEAAALGTGGALPAANSGPAAER